MDNCLSRSPGDQRANAQDGISLSAKLHLLSHDAGIPGAALAVIRAGDDEGK